MFEETEVEEFQESQGFKAVAKKWIAVADHFPRLENSTQQGSRRSVEYHHIYLVGFQVRNHHPNGGQSRIRLVYSVIQVYGDIDVTQRPLIRPLAAAPNK